MQDKSAQRGLAAIVLLIVFAVLLVGFGGYYLKSNGLSIFQPAPLTLALDSPADETLVASSTLSVGGKTKANAIIALYTETSENSVEADAGGNFTGTIELTEGINTLVVTAFSEDGQEKSVSVDVVYDSQANTY